MTEVKLRIPERITAGECIAVQSLVAHPMSDACRREGDATDCYIQETVVTYDGREVARYTWPSGLATDPVVSFKLHADREGPITMRCRDNRGAVFETSVDVSFTRPSTHT